MEIKDCVLSHLEQEAHSLPPVELQFVIDTVVNTIPRLINKYIKGSKKHGGNLLANRDLPSEMEQEVFDQFWYLAAQKHTNKVIT